MSVMISHSLPEVAAGSLNRPIAPALAYPLHSSSKKGTMIGWGTSFVLN